MIFEESITLINSIPGAGKTTLCYNLCAFGSLNQVFLELSFSKPIKILYLDAETPNGIRKQKIENICGELPQDFYFLEITDFRKDYAKLLSLCKREKYDILVFDTLSRIVGFENENDNAEANHIMGLIRRITIEAGCSVIIVHHTSKSEDSKGVYWGRGASAIPAAVDVVINLEELDQDTLKLKVEKNRIIGNKTELCLIKIGEDRFEPLYQANGQKAGYEIFEAQNLILSMPANEELPTNQICQYGIDEGFNKRTMERAISGLTQSGKLKRLRKGIYIIVKTGVSDSSDSSAGINPDGIVGLADSMVNMI